MISEKVQNNFIHYLQGFLQQKKQTEMILLFKKRK